MVNEAFHCSSVCLQMILFAGVDAKIVLFKVIVLGVNGPLKCILWTNLMFMTSVESETACTSALSAGALGFDKLFRSF